MHQKILNRFKKLNTFWGDYLDSRFYLTSKIMNERHPMVVDVGCASGIILSFDPSPLKIGIDIKMESLRKCKNLWPHTQCIQADAQNLPIKNNTFSKVIAIGILPVFEDQDSRKSACEEISRISKKGSKIFIYGPNRRSKFFTIRDEAYRTKYLYHTDVKTLFDDFELEIEGYGAFSKPVMFAIRKLVYNIPEILLEKLGIENIVFRLLKSKKYLKDGRSYVAIGFKK